MIFNSLGLVMQFLGSVSSGRATRKVTRSLMVNFGCSFGGCVWIVVEVVEVEVSVSWSAMCSDICEPRGHE